MSFRIVMLGLNTLGGPFHGVSESDPVPSSGATAAARKQTFTASEKSQVSPLEGLSPVAD